MVLSRKHNDFWEGKVESKGKVKGERYGKA